MTFLLVYYIASKKYQLISNCDSIVNKSKSGATVNSVKMIKRPKPGDTEQEILQMQNEFLSEKSKNREFQPAAKLVKVTKCKLVSFVLFYTKFIVPFSAKGLSHFAQRRAQLRQELDEKKRIADESNRIANDIEREHNEKPEPQSLPSIKFILGNIVERKRNAENETISQEIQENPCGFPHPHRIDQNVGIVLWGNFLTFNNLPNV